MRVPLQRTVDPADAVLPRRGVEAGLPIELLHHGPGFPIHGPGVVRQGIDARPVYVPRRLALLADCATVGGAGDRHALQVVRYRWLSPRHRESVAGRDSRAAAAGSRYRYPPPRRGTPGMSAAQILSPSFLLRDRAGTVYGSRGNQQPPCPSQPGARAGGLRQWPA